MKTIAELVTLPKKVARIKRVPKKEGHTQLDIEAHTTCGLCFTVWVRVLNALPESFTLGLSYHHKKSKTILLRWNGDHGIHRNPDGTVVEGPHIHRYPDHGLDAPPIPGLGPPDAVSLPCDGAPSVAFYWNAFKAAIALQCDDKVDRKVRGLHSGLAQMQLSLDDDNDGEHGGHDDDAGTADDDAEGGP